jgi:hypothetical protein
MDILQEYHACETGETSRQETLRSKETITPIDPLLASAHQKIETPGHHRESSTHIASGAVDPASGCLGKGVGSGRGEGRGEKTGIWRMFCGSHSRAAGQGRDTLLRGRIF